MSGLMQLQCWCTSKIIGEVALNLLQFSERLRAVSVPASKVCKHIVW